MMLQKYFKCAYCTTQWKNYIIFCQQRRFKVHFIEEVWDYFVNQLYILPCLSACLFTIFRYWMSMILRLIKSNVNCLPYSACTDGDNGCLLEDIYTLELKLQATLSLVKIIMPRTTSTNLLICMSSANLLCQGFVLDTL